MIEVEILKKALSHNLPEPDSYEELPTEEIVDKKGSVPQAEKSSKPSKTLKKSKTQKSKVREGNDVEISLEEFPIIGIEETPKEHPSSDSESKTILHESLYSPELLESKPEDTIIPMQPKTVSQDKDSPEKTEKITQHHEDHMESALIPSSEKLKEDIPKTSKESITKLQKSTIERKETVLKKLTITEGPASLAGVKLKPSMKKLKEDKPQPKFPKFMLKSRIKLNVFPPSNEQYQTPNITICEPLKKSNGVLSRNMKEAEKVPKTKPRKLKKIDEDLKKLESLDMEFEDLKKNELEQVEELYRKPIHEKKPKKKDSLPEILIGTGKIPEQDSIEMPGLKGITKEIPQEIIQSISEIDFTVKYSEASEISLKNSKYEMTFKPHSFEMPESETEIDESKEIEHSPAIVTEKLEELPSIEAHEPKTFESEQTSGKPMDKKIIEPTDDDRKGKLKRKPEKRGDHILKPIKKIQEEDEVHTIKEEKIVQEIALAKLIVIPETEEETQLITTETMKKKTTKKKKVPKPDQVEIIEDVPVNETQETIEEIPVETITAEEVVIKEIPDESHEEPVELRSDIREPRESVLKPSVEKVKKKKKSEGQDSTQESKILDKVEESPQKVEFTDISTLDDVIIENLKPSQKEEPTETSELEYIPSEIKPTEKKVLPEKVQKTEQKTDKKIPRVPKMKKDRPIIPRLKSRIRYIQFPPDLEQEKIPIVKMFEPLPKNTGVLSRTMAEANKIPKKKKKPKKDDSLEILEQLDKEMEEIKQEHKLEEVNAEYRKKPEKPDKPRKELPPPTRIEWKSVLPSKVMISEITEKPLNLSDIKLRKTSIAKPKEVKTVKSPKVLLKSRIQHLKFPPEIEAEKLPLIKVLEPVEPQNGVLSHNHEEAMKILKMKKRKLKDSGMPTISLEELDLEMDDIKKTELEKVDDEYHVFNRTPKEKKTEAVAPAVTIKLGKGKIPEKPEESEEVITLKKRNKSVETSFVTEETLPRPRKSSEVTITEDIPSSKQKLAPLEIIDFDRTEPELEKYIPDEEESPDEKTPEKQKSKYHRKPKNKPTPEIVAIPLEKGTPKEPDATEDEEVKFRIPSRKIPDEEPSEITLKPFKKSEDDDKNSFTMMEIEKPQSTLESQDVEPVTLVLEKKKSPEPTESSEDVKVKLKKPKTKTPKPKGDEAPKTEETIPEVKREDIPVEISTQEKAQPSQSEGIPAKIIPQETPEEETVVEILETPDVVLEPEELITGETKTEKKTKKVIKKTKKIPEPEKQTSDESTEEITITKKLIKKKPADQDEVSTTEFVLQKPRETKETSITQDETIVINKKDKPKSSEEAEAVLKIEKPASEIIETFEKNEEETREIVLPQPHFDKKLITEEEETTITRKKKTPKSNDKTQAETTEKVIPKDEISETKPTKIPSEEKPEESTEEITITKTTKKKKPVHKDDEEKSVSEKVETTIIKTKKRPKIADDAEAEIHIKKLSEAKPEEQTQDITIKTTKKKPVQKDDETSAEFTLQKPKVDEEEKSISEEVEATITRTKKRPQVTEDAQAELHIEKPSDEVPEESSEDVTITKTLKQKKPVPKDDETSAEFTMQKPKADEEKPITEEVEATITKKKKKPKAPEDEQAELRIKKLAPEEKEEPEINKDVTEVVKKIRPVEKNEEINVEFITKKPENDSEEVETTIKAKKKKPKKPDEAQDEFHIKKMEFENEEVTLPERKPDSDEVQEFTIKKKPLRKPSIEEHSEEITIKKLRKPRKPSKPDIPEFTDVTDVTFRPKVTKTKEDVDQEFKISLDSYAEEEISMSGKIRLTKKRPSTYSEEAGQETIRIFQEVEEEGPLIEEIIDEGSDAEELPYDDESPENFHVSLKKNVPRKYSVFEEDEESVSIGLKKKTKTKTYEEESITLKPKRKSISTFDQGKCIGKSICKNK